ncbi:MAG: restriction endonuclease subunit S domain-containing protein, partial [Methanosarcina sp.]
ILKIQTTLNQAICGLIPDTKQVSSEYLYYMLLFIRNEIKTGSKDRTQMNSNQTKLGNSEIDVFEDEEIREKLVNELLEFETHLKL